MKTEAAVLTGYGAPLLVTDIDLDDPRPGEVLVRVHAAGLCFSDLNTIRGTMTNPLPAVIGHEAAGVVAGLGEGVTSAAVGDRVMLSWYPSCGRCDNCLRALPHLCTAYEAAMDGGFLADGTTRMSWSGRPLHHFTMTSAFARHTVVPAAGVVPIPDDVPVEIAAITGCAVASGVGAVLNATTVRPGDRVAVFGCGGVGMSAVLGARAAGAGQVVAVDVRPHKLELARELGATGTVLWSGTPDDVARAVVAVSGAGVDHAVEATGRVDVAEAAVASTRDAGTTVLAGIPSRDARITLPGRLLARSERKVVGSFYGSADPTRTFARILDLYRRGLLPLDALVTQRLALEDINDGFSAMADGEPVRAVVLMPG